MMSCFQARVPILWFVAVIIISNADLSQSDESAQDVKTAFARQAMEISDLLRMFTTIIEKADKEEGRELGLPEITTTGPLNLESANLEELFDRFETAAQSFRTRFLKYLKTTENTFSNAPREDSIVIELSENENQSKLADGYEYSSAVYSEEGSGVLSGDDTTVAFILSNDDISEVQPEYRISTVADIVGVEDFEIPTEQLDHKTDDALSGQSESTSAGHKFLNGEAALILESTEEKNAETLYSTDGSHEVIMTTFTATDDSPEYIMTTFSTTEDDHSDKETMESDSLTEGESDDEISTISSIYDYELVELMSTANSNEPVSEEYSSTTEDSDEQGSEKFLTTTEDSDEKVSEEFLSEDSDEEISETVRYSRYPKGFSKRIEPKQNQPVTSHLDVIGEPGENYPNYTHIPTTTFTCEQRKRAGFYADLETRCQVFHVCWPHRMESYLCPVGSTFSQEILSCDYWYSSTCHLSPDHYDANLHLKDYTTQVEDGLHQQFTNDKYPYSFLPDLIHPIFSAMKILPFKHEFKHYSFKGRGMEHGEEINQNKTVQIEFDQNSTLPSIEELEHQETTDDMVDSVKDRFRELLKSFHDSSKNAELFDEDYDESSDDSPLHKTKLQERKYVYEKMSQSNIERSGILSKVSDAQTTTVNASENHGLLNKGTHSKIGKEQIAPAIAFKALETAENIMTKGILPITRDLLAANYIKLYKAKKL